MGVSYKLAREGWLADPRIGRSHTFGYPNNRGYGGSCLPKDTRALSALGLKYGSDMTLLNSVIAKNVKLRGDNNENDS